MRTHVVQMLREAKMNEERELPACLAAAGCARSITPEEALRILETMDQECQHAEPLQGSVAEALNLNQNQAPSTDGHCRADCRAARAGAKASPVRATCRGGAAARTEPAKGGLGDAVLVELRNQQTPLAEKRARRTMGKIQSARVLRRPAWGPGDELLVRLRILQPRLRDLRARRRKLSGRPC
jgi:hypothetical protein